MLPQYYQSVTIRLAKPEDVDGAKLIAAQCAEELGFVNIATLLEAQKKDWLLIASRHDIENQSEEVIGFINFRIKKDNNGTLYEIAVKKDYRGKGIGKRLLNDLIWRVFVTGGTELRLKCPVDLLANNFYQRNNFILYGTEPGRKRELNIWKYHISVANLPKEKTEAINNSTAHFYASLTVKPDEIRKLYSHWHQYAHNFHWIYGKPNPFERILISPLVARKKTFAFIKEMKKTGEAKQVMFDSGGYFVQKGQISYYDLHRNLYELYKKEAWADIYVLPDNPPLSRDSLELAESKIRQTVEGSLRLYRDLPEHIREKAMPVIHALKSEHIDYCLRNYVKEDQKFRQIGFGTFPTSGSNNSINRLNINALMILKQLIKSLDENGIKMHTFGISTPPAIYLLSLVGVHSFDSNGWMRSGGYGLVFLPYSRGYLVTFNSRRQESLNEKEFQQWKEVVDHCCPFCNSFRELSENRWFRIMHNLTVMAGLETHHREPKLEVMEKLSKDYYRILQNLNLPQSGGYPN